MKVRLSPTEYATLCRVAAVAGLTPEQAAQGAVAAFCGLDAPEREGEVQRQDREGWASVSEAPCVRRRPAWWRRLLGGAVRVLRRAFARLGEAPEPGEGG